MRRKKEAAVSPEAAADWLRKAVRNAPHPLPAGVFPKLMSRAEAEGFRREWLMDVLDVWLAAGYCRIVDSIDQDIEITPEGLKFF